MQLDSRISGLPIQHADRRQLIQLIEQIQAGGRNEPNKTAWTSAYAAIVCVTAWNRAHLPEETT